MRNTQLLLTLAALAGLAGCAVDVAPAGSAAALLDDAATCEPEHVLPLRLTDGSDLDVGQLSLVTGDQALAFTFDTYEGWELGDLYVYAGVTIDQLVQYQLNPEPWLTGYLTHAELQIPLTDFALSCGGDFKVYVQGKTRRIGTYEAPVFFSAVQDGVMDPPVWGWYGWHTVCCVDPNVVTGCTFTQGYWKNHADAWPVSHLDLGLTRYSAEELATLLSTPPRGDASVVLAHQLVAALLNLQNGASGVQEIGVAQQWMAAHGNQLPYGIRPNTTAGAEAVDLADALAAYNEGTRGPGHCGD